MALAGLPVPADKGTRIPVYDAVFADIGDEQSIEQSLSTFSGHVTAIIDILERAGPRSLVLLDELGAGTDPTEGAALAIAIVGRFVEAGATLIATTHHSELKLFAHREAGVLNASVEFDVETLSPTYRLRIGVPGQSNALAIAERLGMPGAIVEAAREGLSHGQRDLEAVLGDLRTQLSAAEDRAARAAADRDAAEELRGDLERQLATLADESERLRAESHEPACARRSATRSGCCNARAARWSRHASSRRRPTSNAPARPSRRSLPSRPPSRRRPAKTPPPRGRGLG